MHRTQSKKGNTRSDNVVRLFSSFEPGRVVASAGALRIATQTPGFVFDDLLDRHCHADWGDLGEDDRLANESALANRNDRILSRYDLAVGSFYVITEADRSLTTILLPEEY